MDYYDLQLQQDSTREVGKDTWGGAIALPLSSNEAYIIQVKANSFRINISIPIATVEAHYLYPKSDKACKTS